MDAESIDRLVEAKIAKLASKYNGEIAQNRREIKALKDQLASTPAAKTSAPETAATVPSALVADLQIDDVQPENPAAKTAAENDDDPEVVDAPLDPLDELLGNKPAAAAVPDKKKVSAQQIERDAIELQSIVSKLPAAAQAQVAALRDRPLSERLVAARTALGMAPLIAQPVSRGQVSARRESIQHPTTLSEYCALPKAERERLTNDQSFDAANLRRDTANLRRNR